MRYQWSRPHVWGIVAGAASLLLWLASGCWCVAIGDGRSRGVWIVDGYIAITWGHPFISPCMKRRFAEGFELWYSDYGRLDLKWGWYWTSFSDRGIDIELGLGWVFVPLPAALLIASCRRRAKPPPGHCKKCGYDLTGTSSGRCPECGSAAVGTVNDK